MTEKRWFTLPNGRQVYRAVPARPAARSDLPVPYLISDNLDAPLYSGADGQQYTSKAALRASYRASGNPQGIEYTEVGNDLAPISERGLETSDKGIDESIMKAIAQLS